MFNRGTGSFGGETGTLGGAAEAGGRSRGWLGCSWVTFSCLTAAFVGLTPALGFGLAGRSRTVMPLRTILVPFRRTGGLDKDIVLDPLLVLGRAEAPGLKLEHGSVAPAERHQLVVGAKLHDLATLQHADAVGVTHRREAV